MPRGDNSIRPAVNWRERGFSKPGPKPGLARDLRRDKYVKMFNVSNIHPGRTLSVALMDQLDRCQSDDARRLLMKNDGRTTGNGRHSGEGGDEHDGR
jgi:hypothetical protein